MAIVGIVAVDRQGAIGKAGKLPWHYKTDLQFFRDQTMGHACVMGYRTWLSLRAVPLKNRLNIVLSRQTHITRFPSVIFLPQESSALTLHDYLGVDLFVIGGAETYRIMLPHIERWVVTEVPLTIEDADTFMPEDFLNDFRETEMRDLGEGLVAKFYERATAAGAERFLTRNP